MRKSRVYLHIIKEYLVAISQVFARYLFAITIMDVVLYREALKEKLHEDTSKCLHSCSIRRPPHSVEKFARSQIIEVASSKELIVRERPHETLSKKFTFDRVFGPSSTQMDIYNAVVNPLLDEVLAGYNCTVFAYGQTGTGKTFTMEGICNDPTLHWQSDTSAGIIPRALSHLFDELRSFEAQEYTVRVSFLELYNEELFDLLSPNDDASKIRLYEDTSRKGAVIIHGLEEVTVHNKVEVYKILEKGTEKRKTAATLMNAHSSRSHTVFSITVHIKENTVEGEELLKTGKLNLVDLAGSENVGRSGAVDRRAREAGNINQSLLTLGRVITGLVERAPHIPYRESKLTRLLQESLGGRTKTSIIATVSPASINLEETLSTLDYAHRAKNITNRPEINQKLSKKALLKEYTEEIERLRRDLLATREKNGVYLAQDNYNEMQALIDCQSREIDEKINRIKALEENINNKMQIFADLQVVHAAQGEQLINTKNQLACTADMLKATTHQLHTVKTERDEQKYLVEKHVETEKTLLSQAEEVLSVADTASTDTYSLHDKIMRKMKVEKENQSLVKSFKTDIGKCFQSIENDLSACMQEVMDFCVSMKDDMSRDILTEELFGIHQLSQDMGKSHAVYQTWLEKQLQDVSCMTEHECQLLHSISVNLAPKIQQLIQHEIAENSRSLNSDVSQKLEGITTSVHNSMNVICNRLLADRNYLCERLETIKKSVQILVCRQNEIIEKRQLFSKALDQINSQYNDLIKSETEGADELITRGNQISDACNEIDIQTTNSCEQSLDNRKVLDIAIENDVRMFKSNIASSTDKNCRLIEKSIQDCTILINELQTNLNASCHKLVKHNELVKWNVKELNDKMEEDKTANLTSIANHIALVKEQREKVFDIREKMRCMCTNQMDLSSDGNSKITTQLRTTQNLVEKFFKEDLRHDVPTGHTPGRREFQFPRQFVTTSPHERIIKKFREARKHVDECSDDEEVTITNNDETVYSTFDSPVLSNTLLSTSDNEVNCNESLGHTIVKAASTPNLTIPPVPLLVEGCSESDISVQNNENENLIDQFVKPKEKKSQRLSKPKRVHRRVLGEYN